MSINVVICYEERDEKSLEILIKFLLPIERGRQINISHKYRVWKGKSEQKDLSHCLKEARIILLLLSQNLVESANYLEVVRRIEVRAEQGSVKVIPILLSPTTGLTTNVLKKFQPLPRDRKPVSTSRNKEDTFSKIAREIRDVVIALQKDQGAASSDASHTSGKYILRHSWKGHRVCVWSVALLSDETALASGDEEGFMGIWGLDKEKTQELLKIHEKGITDLAFDRDGELGARSSYDQSVVIWALEKGTVLTLKGHTNTVWSIAFAPDAPLLAGGGNDCNVRIWSVQDGRQVMKLNDGQKEGITDIVFSSDGALLASSSFDTVITLWDMRAGKVKKRLIGHEGVVRCVAFDPRGGILVSGGDDGTMRIWDVSTGKANCILEGHAARISCLAFNADGSVLASGGYDGKIKIWDTRRWQVVQILDEYEDRVTSISLSRDGNILASGGMDSKGNVKVWVRQ